MCSSDLIETCIKPYITYSFATGAYTKNDIARLDSLVTQIAKGAWNLPQAVPNGMVHEDRDMGGLGVTSLLTDYAHCTAALLTQALNDKGRLGAVTRALIPLQVQSAGHELTHEMASTLRYSRLVRSLTMLKAKIGRAHV